jgi:hypothetical protein
MNKKFLYYFLIVVFVGVLPNVTSLIRSHFEPKPVSQACLQETKICPDGTSVVRILPNCDFTSCPVPTTSTSSSETIIATSSQVSTTTVTQITPSINPQKVVSTPQANIQTKPKSFISKIVSSITSAVTTIISNQVPSGNPNDASIPASTYIPSPIETTSVYKPMPPKDFAGQKYLVKDNNIISNDNKVIYTIPPEVIIAVSSSNTGWTNTTINVVPVGSVAPVPPNNAIPIVDLPGKYYLSENSFGDMSACEFSNKIFILDIYTNTVTLMYEENSSTLSHDNPRACNSEIFLLATESSKLVLKYHTIGTNTLCDSAWSEPDKTFYLDVTKLQQGMAKYSIYPDLTVKADQEEEACRAKL